MAVKPNEDEFCVREVWADNLDSEFDLIRAIVDDFPYVSMDTEFPGTVVRPTLPKDSPDHNYQSLRANVNILKIIQVGLTLCDESGSLPRCGSGGQFCVWQFNFRDFNIREDVYAQDSIELLKQSGMDFIQNKERGVDSLRFAELMMSSGLVLNPDVHWITFHSAYDFGYLLKALTSQKLPAMEVDFLTLLRVYFPNVYDVKYLMKFHDSLYGGLNRLAEILGVKRIGKSHQSGSDSLLTSCCFRELKHSYFTLAIEKFGGVLFGLGVDNCGAQ